MQPSQRVVTATASAIRSCSFGSSRSCPAAVGSNVTSPRIASGLSFTQSPTRSSSASRQPFQSRIISLSRPGAGRLASRFAPAPAQAWRPAITPPSTGSTVPVIHEAFGEARNRIASATSAGWPLRPSGWNALKPGSVAFTCSSDMNVL